MPLKYVLGVYNFNEYLLVVVGYRVLFWRRVIYNPFRARVVEWYTRGTQNPLRATSCRFKSGHGHHLTANLLVTN
jgi:hypothetical protein